MLQALLAGVASIKAHQTRMNVIGNNLANVNTTAFKASRATFQDMIWQTVRGGYGPNGSQGGQNPLQFGLGVIVGGTAADLSQGSLNATNRRTDLAIQGNGYLVVSDGSGMSYTRDGSLDIDSTGDLVMRTTGQRVLGWMANSAGVVDTNAPLDPNSYVTLPLNSISSAQVTSLARLSGNLDSNPAAGDPDPATSMIVFDSLGASHKIDLKFTNRSTPPQGTAPAGATSSWEWTAAEGATSVGSFSSTGNERLYFDTNGVLLNPTALGNLTIPASGAANAFDVDLNFSGMTQRDAGSNPQMIGQDGYPTGSLEDFAIAPNGMITGIFTNGMTRRLGQVAMATFTNPGGLERMGNNLFRGTDNSGIAEIGEAGDGGRGIMNSGFLEQSNVDISQEFTDLIVTQRGFQANTRVVTTVDEMLQDLINIKR